MICAARRARGGRGRCVVRAVPDRSGATYRRFAEEHIGRSAHVRADGLPSIGAGLRGFPGLDRRKFDGSDPDASLPTARHVIPDFEAWALGTFHGVYVHVSFSGLSILTPCIWIPITCSEGDRSHLAHKLA